MRHKNKFLAWVMAGIIIMGLTGCAAAEENEIIPQDNSGYENSESKTEAASDTVPAVVTTETADITTTATAITEQTTTTSAVIEEISTTTEIPVTKKIIMTTNAEETSTETSEISETQNAPTQENDDEKYIFINKYGDIVDIREADKLSIMYGYDVTEFTPDEALESKEFIADFNGYTYMTKSIGVSYNSLTHQYNEETYSFDVKIPKHNYEYFKVSVGDSFGNLLVKNAFINYYYNEIIGFQARDLSVSFSGNLNITGYITKIIDNDIGYYDKGDLYFVADANSLSETSIFILSSNLPKHSLTLYNFIASTDIAPFFLGNEKEYTNNFDISIIPDNRTFAHVMITISDIELKSLESGSSSNVGKIVNISLIDE